MRNNSKSLMRLLRLYNKKRRTMQTNGKPVSCMSVAWSTPNRITAPYMRHEPTIAMLFNFGLESLMYLERIISERTIACLTWTAAWRQTSTSSSNINKISSSLYTWVSFWPSWMRGKWARRRFLDWPAKSSCKKQSELRFLYDTERKCANVKHIRE